MDPDLGGPQTCEDPDQDPQHWCQERNARGLPGPIFYLDFKLSSLFTVPESLQISGIVGQNGGMKKAKKEKENCVKKEMHVDHCCQMAESWAAGLKMAQ
jgi:hypothetical protein